MFYPHTFKSGIIHPNMVTPGKSKAGTAPIWFKQSSNPALNINYIHSALCQGLMPTMSGDLIMPPRHRNANKYIYFNYFLFMPSNFVIIGTGLVPLVLDL